MQVYAEEVSDLLGDLDVILKAAVGTHKWAAVEAKLLCVLADHAYSPARGCAFLFSVRWLCGGSCCVTGGGVGVCGALQAAEAAPGTPGSATGVVASPPPPTAVTLATARGNTGLALSNDGQRIVVVNHHHRTVTAYAVSTGKDLWSVGGNNGLLRSPTKACFVPGADLLLVGEDANRRIHVLTASSGRSDGSIGEGTFVGSVVGVAASSEELVGVQDCDVGVCKVLVFDTKRQLLRQFGTTGPILSPDGTVLVDLLGCSGVRIAPTSGAVLLTNARAGGVSVFSRQGSFQKTVALKDVSCPSDVTCCEDDVCVVCDRDLHALTVFRLESEKQEKVLGCYGTAPGQYMTPVALAYHHGRLFVLEEDCARVQIIALM